MKATRTVVIDGVEYVIPDFVHRVKAGWVAKPHKDWRSSYLGDRTNGGTKNALMRAESMVYELMDERRRMKLR